MDHQLRKQVSLLVESSSVPFSKVFTVLPREGRGKQFQLVPELGREALALIESSMQQLVWQATQLQAPRFPKQIVKVKRN